MRIWKIHRWLSVIGIVIFLSVSSSLHLEYAHNGVSGPAAIIARNNPIDEVRIGLRVSLQGYTRL